MFRDNSFKLAVFTVLVFGAIVYFALAPIADMGDNKPFERYFDEESGMYVFLSDNGIAVACPCNSDCDTLNSGGPNPIVAEIEPTRDIVDGPAPTRQVEPTRQPDVPAPTRQVEPTRQPDAPTPSPTSQPDVPAPTPDSDERQRCNRGLGNGSEDCDPGNSYGQGNGAGRRAGEDRHEKDRGKNK